MSETVTMTLTEFLLARITEDESRLPCANCGRPVEPDGPREDGEFGHVAAAEREGSPTAEEFWANPCPSPEPSRKMLAECEAKRRIVEEHASTDEGEFYPGSNVGSERITDEDEPFDLACVCCGEWGEYAVPWPCLTLRALALPYADHPEFNPEWTP